MNCRPWKTKRASSSSPVQFIPDPPAPPGHPSTSAQSDVQELVQASTSEVIQSLTNGRVQTEERPVTSKNPFISASVPLTHRVTEKICNKIWAGEFVDFSTLCSPQDTEGQYLLKFQNNEGNTAVSMVPNVRRKTFRTLSNGPWYLTPSWPDILKSIRTKRPV